MHYELTLNDRSFIPQEDMSKPGFSDHSFFILNGYLEISISYLTAKRAIDVGTTLKSSLEQRNDIISTKFRRCSNVMCPLGRRCFNADLFL